MGATGIVGQTIAAKLVDLGWDTFGLSRSGGAGAGVSPVRADLSDPEGLSAALDGVRPSLVAVTAWTRQDTEAENIRVNGGAVRNLLAALEPAGSVEHVALMTGLKHYLGPFEAYATGVMADTPFREEEPRLDSPNFYYAQEDEVFDSAERNGFTWSVHRSHTVFGFATGNAMNMVLTLSAYATICKERGLPFVFPGSATQWNQLTDVTDADLLADQIIWAASHEEGHDQAFNIANGDVFRWRWLWPQVADFFGVDWEGFEGCFPHDSLAVCVAARPECSPPVEMTLAAEVAAAERGRTRPVALGGPHRVALGGDLRWVRRELAAALAAA